MRASTRIFVDIAVQKFVRHTPAWGLKLLPVRLARQCAIDGSTTTVALEQSVKQLLVDVSVIHQSDARTGIQRVVRSLLLQLLNDQPIGFRVRPVFATQQHGYHYVNQDFLDGSASTNKSTSTAVKAQPGDIFLGLDLAAHLLPRHHAQVLDWKRNGVKVHMMVYDLLPLQHPQWFNPKTTRNFKRWIKWLAVYADSAICISESVKAELSTWLTAKFDIPSTSLPTSSITLGADIAASAPTSGLPPDAEFLVARLRNSSAVLMVGTLEPRKGYDQAIAAFELLWLKDSGAPLLIIVGRPGWKTDSLRQKLQTHPQAGKRLFWFEDASDEFLVTLYSASRGVLVASRAEGFGLPVIEAALHGKPVLARDLAVFREINLHNVTYFKGDQPDSLAMTIAQWLQNSTTSATGQIITSRFTWQLAAMQVTQILGLTNQTTLQSASLAPQHSGLLETLA
jgi:glycosyltransferase involved in cell wall biosynthesis